MLGRYSVLARSIYKSNLNDLVFCNLKPVKLHVACIAEQNISRNRTLDKGTKDTVNNKLRYWTKIRRTDKTSKVLEIRSCLGFHASFRCNSVPTFRDNLSVPSPPIGSDTACSYHSTLRKIPDDRRSQVHRGGSLKSHKSLKCPPPPHNCTFLVCTDKKVWYLRAQSIVQIV